MASYLIVDIDVRDQKEFDRYRELVPPVIAKFGGRYLVKAGKLQPLEGDFGLKRLVIIEFPTMDAAREFYNSAEYAPLLKLRLDSAPSKMVLVDGWIAAE